MVADAGPIRVFSPRRISYPLASGCTNKSFIVPFEWKFACASIIGICGSDCVANGSAIQCAGLSFVNPDLARGTDASTIRDYCVCIRRKVGAFYTEACVSSIEWSHNRALTQIPTGPQRSNIIIQITFGIVHIEKEGHVDFCVADSVGSDFCGGEGYCGQGSDIERDPSRRGEN